MQAQGVVCCLKSVLFQNAGEVNSAPLFFNGDVQQKHWLIKKKPKKHWLVTRFFDRLIDIKYTWYRHINYVNNRDTFFHTFSYKKPRHLGRNYCYRIQTTSFRVLAAADTN